MKYLSFGLLLILMIVKMILSNRPASWGRNLENIKLEAQTLKAENLLLQAELAQKSGGLSQLEQRAQALGFTTNPHIKHFDLSISVAQKLP